MPKLGSSLTDAERARITSSEVEVGSGDENTQASHEDDDNYEDQDENLSPPTASTGNCTNL
jgi:hypothetical protein